MIVRPLASAGAGPPSRISPSIAASRFPSRAASAARCAWPSESCLFLRPLSTSGDSPRSPTGNHLRRASFIDVANDCIKRWRLYCDPFTDISEIDFSYRERGRAHPAATVAPRATALVVATHHALLRYRIESQPIHCNSHRAADTLRHFTQNSPASLGKSFRSSPPSFAARTPRRRLLFHTLRRVNTASAANPPETTLACASKRTISV